MTKTVKVSSGRRFGLSPTSWKLILLAVVVFAALPFLARNSDLGMPTAPPSRVGAASSVEISKYFKATIPTSWRYESVEATKSELSVKLNVPAAFAATMMQKSSDQQLAMIAPMCPSAIEPLSATLSQQKQKIRIQLHSDADGNFFSISCG